MLIFDKINKKGFLMLKLLINQMAASNCLRCLRSGFSLIEMMVVVAIIGMLVALIGPRAVKFLSKSEITATKAILSEVKTAIVEYQADIGHIPTQAEGGLRALVEKPNKESAASKWREPYLEEEKLADKWGNDIVYNVPPVLFKEKYKRFELISHGPTGQEDSTDKIHDGA